MSSIIFLNTFQLQEMEGEAKRAPMSYRTQQLSRIRNYRQDLETVTKTKNVLKRCN
jgi:hypothetical protein